LNTQLAGLSGDRDKALERVKSLEREVAMLRPVKDQNAAELAMRGREHMRAGNFAEAMDVLKRTPKDAPTGEVLLTRGEARWKHYLQSRARKSEPVKYEDEEVQEAIKDLKAAEAAKNADALWQLAVIEETTGHIADAEGLYNQGIKKYTDHKQLFETGLR